MQSLLESLKRQAPHFGPTLAKTAYGRGLAVTAKDGTTRPIPLTATPVILDEAEISRRAALSALLSSATFKMARASLAGDRRAWLLSALSPLERKMAEATGVALTGLATTRVDFFVSGRPMALEVNATIPAMQGYSDIAAHGFLEAVGGHLGLSAQEISALTAENGSNAQALHRALLDWYAQARRGATPNRIALLCRRNDAQITEQRFLAQRFRELGTEADVVHPDQLSGEDAVRANGRPYDLVYRHLFVRRLEETPSAYVEQLLLEVPNRRAVVVNPPASQVEVKAVFALLSQALEEPALAQEAALTAEELAAIREAVPWTRAFRPGPTHDPDGQRVADLVERVAATPERFVLKRSWDYGGKTVFVGAAAGTPSFDERVEAAYGAKLDWAQVCRRAAQDEVGGGFVVQQFVHTAPEPHVLCTEQGIRDVELFVDYSCYASVGLPSAPRWGGVCRGSLSQIVNIVGGGGVLPLLTAGVARKLQAAFARRP